MAQSNIAAKIQNTICDNPEGQKTSETYVQRQSPSNSILFGDLHGSDRSNLFLVQVPDLISSISTNVAYTYMYCDNTKLLLARSCSPISKNTLYIDTMLL